MSEIQIPVLFGFGNPLLDLSLKTDDTILKKYNLDANKVYLSSPETLPLFDEIVQNPLLQKVPGGSSQNSIRAFQWLSSVPKSAGFSGGVADDTLGSQQRDLMLNAGIDVHYHVAKGERTGKCAALITGNHRCLVADIAAASSYNPSFLYDLQLKTSLSKAKVVYAEGFFIDVSVEALLIVAHRCLAAGNAFGINLSAGWVIGKCFAGILELLPFVTYIFCNEDEARAFAGQAGWSLESLRTTLPGGDGAKGDEDVREIAKRLALLPKVDAATPRVVVITQGKDNVILATIPAGQSAGALSLPSIAASQSATATTTTTPSPSSSSSSSSSLVTVKSYPVPPIPPAEFVDSNGCGDSFVGGFFAALLLHGRTLDEAVDAGVRMAQRCARNEGVQFGDRATFKL